MGWCVHAEVCIGVEGLFDQTVPPAFGATFFLGHARIHPVFTRLADAVCYVLLFSLFGVPFIIVTVQLVIVGSPIVCCWLLYTKGPTSSGRQ